MNTDSKFGGQGRASVTQWLFGSNTSPNDLKGSANPSFLNSKTIDNAAIDDDSVIKAGESRRARSGSMTERLGLHKVPTHDHEAIIRGDFHH